MNQFVISTWRSGLRNRAIHGVLVLGLLLVGVAFLASSFSPRQPQTVAMDVGFSGVRLSLVLLALFWVQDMIGREIDRRTVLLSIAYPIGRSHYFVGRYLGIVALLAMAAVMLGLLLGVAVAHSGGGYAQGFGIAVGLPYWLTLVGIWADVAVVSAFAMWVAAVSTVPVMPFALGLAFAVAGKSLGAVAEYMAKGADGDVDVMRLAPIIDMIHWVLPDLSRLDWRNWPMYGLPPNVETMLAGLALGGLYSALMLWLGIMAFSRREFQ